MTAQHTPGPWQFAEYADAGCGIVHHHAIKFGSETIGVFDHAHESHCRLAIECVNRAPALLADIAQLRAELDAMRSSRDANMSEAARWSIENEWLRAAMLEMDAMLGRIGFPRVAEDCVKRFRAALAQGERK